MYNLLPLYSVGILRQFPRQSEQGHQGTTSTMKIGTSRALSDNRLSMAQVGASSGYTQIYRCVCIIPLTRYDKQSESNYKPNKFEARKREQVQMFPKAAQTFEDKSIQRSLNVYRIILSYILKKGNVGENSLKHFYK